MVKNVASDPAEPGFSGARAGLIILSLTAFAAVTTEMVPVGLLPAIGHTFGVAESTTGLLVSLYAVLVATLAVPPTLPPKCQTGQPPPNRSNKRFPGGNFISPPAPSPRGA